MENKFYIVGIGASAGGLEALEKMFQKMPSNTGMAFVVVQHLSPDFKSLMDELLARHTKMPIHRVTDGMVVEPNSLYLIPPKQLMTIEDGRLRLIEKSESQTLSLPIDHFLTSLAENCGSMSIAIILSGTGSDGSRGLIKVHDAGGLVLVQTSTSSKFDGMPRSASDTGLVDVVADPDKIPDLLMRYANHPIRSQLKIPPIDESSMEHMFRLLQERHRIDFSFYKPKTIGRRIERRIQLSEHDHIEDYVEQLETDPAEVDQLYKDLLIGVTRFFRDTEAFQMLRNSIMPDLLRAHSPSEEFRLWVAACGTGEEAYSIAIIIDECLRELDLRFAVKIFATDVHASSLDIAHAGVYPEESFGEMSIERRERYFRPTEDGFRIVPELRERIVFAPHNLVRDAPFTRLSFVTCRNLLIYLLPAAQRKVLSTLHFGLNVGGVMFLGASESLGELSEEFTSLHERWKFFRKQRDVRSPADVRGPMELGLANQRTRKATRGPGQLLAGTNHGLVAIYDELLDRYMPPGILINQQREILHIFGGAGRYLSVADGRPSENLLSMVSGDLKLVLIGGLQRVAKSEQPVSFDRVKLELGEEEKTVRVTLSPVGHPGMSKKFLLTFEGLAAPATPPDGAQQSLSLDDVSRDQLTQLETELQFTKENLQATIEELETSNEELQATNEEMVASNEELQSTNEELHSVNEELYTVNEELYTVNAEYQTKISELTEMTNDMDNLLASAEVHTLFLDLNLNIRKFTPKIAGVFNLVSHDIGRQISSFTHNIECNDLIESISQVVETNRPYEEQVKDNQGRDFLMKILPYRASEEVGGIVLTLIDISLLVKTQNEMLTVHENFQRAVAANRDGTWDWQNVQNETMWWSANCFSLLGYEEDEIPSKYSVWLSLIHPEDRRRVSETSVPDNDKCYVEVHRDFEYRMRHKTLGYRWYRHRAIVDIDENGAPVRMTGSVGDIHDRKCAEMQYIDEIRRRDDFLAMLSHELRNPMGAVLNAIEYSKTQSAQHSNGQANDNGQSEHNSVQLPVEIVERQTRHMARLLDDLLDVARFGQSKIEFRMRVVELKALAEDILESVTFQVDAKQQKLVTKFTDEPMHVYADPARIKQAQVNLLTNASKFTPEGNTIVYQLDHDSSEATISVKDSGAGIAPEKLNTVFDLFFQSEDSLSRCEGGLGVGLSLAKTIVEAHGGTIEASSEGLDKGSTFQIRLPLVDHPIEQSVHRPPLKPFGNLKVLLVEDNEDARVMLAKTLKLKGFQVSAVGNGAMALEELEHFHPDFAVIDIGLPEMDGYELAKRIRANNHNAGITLIALTGYGQKRDQELAIKSGFDEYLVKPLDQTQLYRLFTLKNPSRPNI